MSNKIRSYTELRKLIRASLRMQNPEWVEPNGESPICDSYEARFAELLRTWPSVRRRDDQIPKWNSANQMRNLFCVYTSGKIQLVISLKSHPSVWTATDLTDMLCRAPQNRPQ